MKIAFLLYPTAGVKIAEDTSFYARNGDWLPRVAITAVALWLLLAGDWIETGLPGTIESAAAAGHMAAQSAMGHRQ